jgi:hypothetical protein
MSEVSNIYDNGPISPVAKIRENLSIFTAGNWAHYRIRTIEPFPRSSPLIAEMVTISGALTIPGNGAVAQQVIAFLRLAEGELLHLRWEPIDDVEGVLWEQGSSAKFTSRGAHARVTRFTALRDPFLATTTFFILGKDRDMNLEVRNPNPVALPMARFVFWGFRYLLEALSAADCTRIEAGQLTTTWLPAEGGSPLFPKP